VIVLEGALSARAIGGQSASLLLPHPRRVARAPCATLHALEGPPLPLRVYGDPFPGCGHQSKERTKHR